MDEPAKYESVDISKHVDTRKLSPILKWPGGKEQELKYILPNLPKQFDNYYEPFVGGGAVYTAVQANRYFINDKSDELIGLYRSINNKDRPVLFSSITSIINNWNVLEDITKQHGDFFIANYKKYRKGTLDDARYKATLWGFVDDNLNLLKQMAPHNPVNLMMEMRANLLRKTKRMPVVEQLRNPLPDKDILDNIEAALKSAYYMHIRHVYNNTFEEYEVPSGEKAAIFLFIRNFAYSGMFRYNASGGFNVPYGGIAYNSKNFKKKVAYLQSEPLQELLNNTVIENLDFEAFFEQHPPGKNDFIFLDPPYDSEFSTYDQNEFTQADQARLATYLITCCTAKWMMVIKSTDYVLGLYANKGLNIRIFDKKYLVSFMNRNDKDVQHLLITNY